MIRKKICSCISSGKRNAEDTKVTDALIGIIKIYFRRDVTQTQQWIIETLSMPLQKNWVSKIPIIQEVL